MEPLEQFQLSLAKSIPGLRGYKFVQIERPHLFTMGDDNKICQNIFTTFKNLLLNYWAYFIIYI